MKKGDCKKINYFIIIIILGLFIIISTNYYKIWDLITQNSDIKESVEISKTHASESNTDKHKEIQIPQTKEYNFYVAIKNSNFDAWDKISKDYLQMIRPTCEWNPNKESCTYQKDFFQGDSILDNQWNSWIFAYKNDQTQLFYNHRSIYEFTGNFSEKFYSGENWSVLEMTFNEYNPSPNYSVSFLDGVNLNKKYWYKSIKEVFFYKWNIWFIVDNSKIYYKNKLLEYDFLNIQNSACCENPSLFQLTKNWYIQLAEKVSNWYKLHEINLEKSLESIIDQEKQTLVWEKIAAKTCIPKEQVKVYTYMYHYIRDKNWDKPNAGFIRNAVITENFDAQMKKFSELENNKKIKIIFLSDLEKFQKEDCYPHKNLVILTSDDGWDDNYINLYPIAKKHNTKFHLSIISSYTKENRYDNFMTKAEVQEVSLDPNFEIIGHTFAHIDLRNLNDFYLSRELCSSKDSLELMTETQINTIIYPAGKYNSQTINKSKICGYKYGFTTKSWINTVKDLEENPFELKRIRVSRDTKVQPLTKHFEQKKTD